MSLHTTLNRRPFWLAGIVATLLAACGSHNDGDGAGAVTPPGTGLAEPTLLLTSMGGGASLLGEATELPLATTDPARTFLKFEGTPWIAGELDFNGHSLVFNGADNRFYGVLDGAGADGLGVLVSLDPATDKLSVLKSFARRDWAGVTGVNGEPLAFEQPSRFVRKPLPSPDGKALLLRALDGGVAGRGALMHINIDPASANYLQETLVYSFFDREKAQGNYCDSLRALPEGVTEMVWGKDPVGAAVVYMGVGGINYDMSEAAGLPTVPGNCHPYTTPSGRPMDKVYGRVFALKPTDPGDLAKPWAYALGYRSIDPQLRLGRQIYWDTSKQAVRWATETVGGGELGLYAADLSGPYLYFGAVEQCYRLQGLLPLNGSGAAIALCSGLNGSSNPPDSPPRIFHYTPTDLFTQQANLGGWYAENKMFRGATSSLVSRRVFVNGGDVSDGCAEGGTACLGGPGTVEELDPATGYVQHVLATGNSATTGYNFLGDPAVGGSVFEPIADRYVVWFGAAVKGYSNVLNKHDRATGLTTTLALDPKNGAHPVGRLLDLGNGRALGLMKNAAPLALTANKDYLKGTGGYAGGAGSQGSRLGHYLVDLKTRQVLFSISQDLSVQAFSTERVRLDDGSVWDALVYQDSGSQSNYRILNKLDPTTGKLTPTALSAARQEAFDYPRDPFALAGRGSTALYLPFWAANVDAAKRYAEMSLGCMRTDTTDVLVQSDAFGPAQSGFGNAHRIVYGATWSPANAAMYLATAKVGDADLGTIFEVDKGVVDADLCKAKPLVTVLVAGLVDVPSTRPLALKNGALVYGTANGKLMRLDVAGRQAALVADLRTGSAASSTVRGYLTEAKDNVVAAVVYDHDAAGNNTTRRLVRVDIGTGAQTERDVSPLIGENEPYPGVMRLN